jgi:hypothetical protein
VLPHGTPEARRGLAVGQIVGGLITLVGGLTGEVADGLATATGIGAAVGVPTIAVSTTLVAGGAGNIAAGIQGLLQSLSTGSEGGSKPALGAAGGPRAGKPFTAKTDAYLKSKIDRNMVGPRDVRTVERKPFPANKAKWLLPQPACAVHPNYDQPHCLACWSLPRNTSQYVYQLYHGTIHEITADVFTSGGEITCLSSGRLYPKQCSAYSYPMEAKRWSFPTQNACYCRPR